MTPVRRLISVAAAALALLAAPPIARAGAALHGADDRIAALGEVGPYAAGFTSFTLVDAARPMAAGAESPRRIPVYLWYPASRCALHGAPRATIPLDLVNRPDLTASSSDLEALGFDPAWQEPAPAAGPFPLLAFSHGSQAAPWFQAGLAARLASHGVVVAIPAHPDDWPFFTWQVAYDHFAWQDYQRPRDLALTITALLRRSAARGDRLRGLIDPEQVAVGGFSYGGMPALALAGGDDTAWDYAASDPYSFMDEPVPVDLPHDPLRIDRRVRAVVLLDGSSQGLKLRELARIRVPVLSVNEPLAAWEDPYLVGYPARQHAVISSRVNLRVDVAGVTHLTIGDLCPALQLMAAKGLEVSWLGDPTEAWAALCTGVRDPGEAWALAARYILAFLKSELEGERSYSRMLTTCWAQAHETGVELFTSEPVKPPLDGPEWPGLETYFMHPPACVAH